MMLPAQTYDFFEIGFGPAVLVIGVLGLLIFAAVTFRNPAAVLSWGFAVLLFIFSGLFGIGFELFWLAVMVTVVLLVIGVVVRWSQ